MKTDHDYIVIEAPESEAVSVFFSRFGIAPNRVSCTCCGPDFDIEEVDDNEDMPRAGNVLVICAASIEPAERTAEVPRQGYVWVG